MTPGEAIDYLMGGANRRVAGVLRDGETAPISAHPGGLYRWRNGTLEHFVTDPGTWLIYPISHFVCREYTKARELPRAPTGTHWESTGIPSDGGALVVESSSIKYDPITDQFERDVMAARVAEYDTRPEPEE